MCRTTEAALQAWGLQLLTAATLDEIFQNPSA
jgi:hypothetical protein